MSSLGERQNKEEDSLILQEDKFGVETGSPSRFLLLKAATIFGFFLSLIPKIPIEIRIILVFVPFGFEFWFTKNADGMELVGMRWSHEIENGNPKLFFYVRPDPYVPEATNVKYFNLGLFGSTAFWGITFLISSFTSTVSTIFISLYIFSGELFNTLCFYQCYNVSTKQADDVARSVMLGDAFDGLSDDPVIQIDVTPDDTNQNSPIPDESIKVPTEIKPEDNQDENEIPEKIIKENENPKSQSDEDAVFSIEN